MIYHVPEMAARFNTTDAAIRARQRRRSKMIPHELAFFLGGKLAWDSVEVDRWLEEQKSRRTKR